MLNIIIEEKYIYFFKLLIYKTSYWPTLEEISPQNGPPKNNNKIIVKIIK